MIYFALFCLGVALAPVIHELSHEAAARSFGKKLRWFLKWRTLLGIPFPRLCWYMPEGLTPSDEAFIARAGFGGEFGGLLVTFGICSLAQEWWVVWVGIGMGVGAMMEWWLYPLNDEASDFRFMTP